MVIFKLETFTGLNANGSSFDEFDRWTILFHHVDEDQGQYIMRPEGHFNTGTGKTTLNLNFHPIFKPDDDSFQVMNSCPIDSDRILFCYTEAEKDDTKPPDSYKPLHPDVHDMTDKTKLMYIHYKPVYNE